MSITITEAAISEVKRLMADHDLKDSVLRMGVRGGGCSGLSYTLGFDKETSDFDQVYDFADGVKVVVDMKSHMFLEGTQLDYTSDLLGGGFKFNNPNARKSCGCGSSFSM